MADHTDDATDDAGIEGSKQRSPNYPLFGLEKAVERAGQFHEKYKRSLVPVHLVHALWDYKPHSPTGNRAVSALKAFGLLEMEGVGKNRRVRLTDTATRILLQSPDRETQLKKAAVGPPIYRELWDRYSGESNFPDNELLSHYLVWDREAGTFNTETVDSFIDNFRDTFHFAGMLKGDIVEGEIIDRDDILPLPPLPDYPRLGDLVQWTPGGGAYRFKEPKRVQGVSQDKEWVFIEGEPSAKPMEEVMVMEKASAGLYVKGQMPPLNPYQQEQKPTDRTEITSGPRIVVDLSRGNSIEIRLKAKITKKELERIKEKVFALAELSFLEDEEDEV